MELRSTRRWIQRASAALAAIVAATAAAQDAPVFPPACDPVSIHGTLAKAGVRTPVDAAIAAWEEYLDRCERQGSEVIEAWVKTQQGASKQVGLRNAPSVEAERKRQDREARMLAEQTALRAALFARLAESVPPADREVIQAVAARDHLRMIIETLRGGSMMMAGPRVPADIGFFIRAERSQPSSDSAEQVRGRLVLAATGVEARTASYAAARKAMLVEVMKRAERADELGVGGKNSFQAHSEFLTRNAAQARAAAAEGRPSPLPERWDEPSFAALLEPDRSVILKGSPAWRQIVQAQLASYREILPRLTEAQRKLLREDWIPTMVGVTEPPKCLPQLSVGHRHRIGPYVAELLRVSSLDSIQRERVRAIGREWVRDDYAIIEAVFASYADDGVSKDPGPELEKRAKRALVAFAAIPGLESLAHDPPEFPTGNVDEPSAADDAEFEVDGRMNSSPEGKTPEEKLASKGLPPGYRADDEERFARLLRLTEGQRPVLHAVMADARGRWQAEVAPAVAAAMPSPRSEVRLDGWKQMLRDSEQRIEERPRIEAAWRTAAAVDAATFEALAAALGEQCDRAALTLLRAARAAQRLVNWENYYDPSVEIATTLLDAPLSDEGRARALAATVPAVDAWVAAREAVRQALAAVDVANRTQAQARIANPSVPSGLTSPTAQEDQGASDAHRRFEQLTEAIRPHEDALAALASSALQGEDRRRWDEIALTVREPDYYEDLRPFWRIVDTAIACAPPEQRAALREQIQPHLDRLSALNRRLGDLAVSGRSDRRPGYDNDSREVGTFVDWTMIRRAAITSARIEALLPPGCRPTKARDLGAFSLHGLLDDGSAPPDRATAATQPAPASN